MDQILIFLASKNTERRFRKSAGQRRPWTDKEFRKRMSATKRTSPAVLAAMEKARSVSYTRASRSAVSRANWSSEDAREARSELMRRKWSSKAFRRRMRKARQASPKVAASLAELRERMARKRRGAA